MSELLIIGFTIGMMHAFQLDHLSAVLSLSVKNTSIYNSVKKGISWGIGHTLTLSLIVIPLFLSNKILFPYIEVVLEMLVGLMLLFLGLTLILALKNNKVHIHTHEHEDGKVHSHIHSHEFTTQNHDISQHNHTHESFITWNTLFVGLVHGFAGSAGLLIILNGLIDVDWWIFPAVIVFGIGSLLGMVAVTFFLSISLKMISKKTEKIVFLIRYFSACFAILVGCFLITDGFISFL